MMFEASAAGRDEAVAALQRAHDREVKLVRDLRRALSNMR
jgi:hypothetical protein